MAEVTRLEATAQVRRTIEAYRDRVHEARNDTEYLPPEGARIVNDYCSFENDWQELVQDAIRETSFLDMMDDGLLLEYCAVCMELDEVFGLGSWRIGRIDRIVGDDKGVWKALQGEFDKNPLINEEAMRHNQNLLGIGEMLNTVNASLCHYAVNNPVRHTAPDGKSIFETRWLSRNWDNLLSIGINISEIVSGTGIATATGVTGAGAFMGGLMVVHGSVNTIAGIGKIVATTIAADLHGDDYADKLDVGMPDTAIGFVGYGMGVLAEALGGGFSDGAFAEKVGALVDLLDVACGIAISANAGKVLTKNINEFIKSSGSKISKTDLLKLQNYLADTRRISASKVLEGILENYDRVTGIDGNMRQIAE